MRRFGCVPMLVILAMAAALLAVSSVAITGAAMGLAGMASSMLSQLIMGIALLGVLGGVGVAVALRSNFVRRAAKAAISRKMNLPDEIEQAPFQAARVITSQPVETVRMVDRRTRLVRPSVRIDGDTLNRWDF